MVAWLLMAGDHTPVIPFVDVVGRAGIKLPEQYGPKVPKVGVIVEGRTVYSQIPEYIKLL